MFKYYSYFYITQLKNKKMKTTLNITRQELISILNGIENPTFVNIVSTTNVKMNKEK